MTAKRVDESLSVQKERAKSNFERHYAVCSLCEDGYVLCSAGRYLRDRVRQLFDDPTMYRGERDERRTREDAREKAISTSRGS